MTKTITDGLCYDFTYNGQPPDPVGDFLGDWFKEWMAEEDLY